MTVRLRTGPLLGLLTDLIRTADLTPEAGILGAVLLHTARGAHGTEVGAVDLFAGASTDRTVAAYAVTWCAGQLARPTLWSVRDARNVVAVFKAARGKDKGNEHAVEITTSPDGDVEIREDPNLIDDGVSLAFGGLDLHDYPGRSLYRILADDIRPPTEAGGHTVPPIPRTDYIARSLGPFLAVATRRAELLQLYRRHQHRAVHVQIGDAYRGVVSPYRGAESGDVHLPDVDLWPPADVDALWPTRPAPEPAPVIVDGLWQLGEHLDLDDLPEEGPTP